MLSVTGRALSSGDAVSPLFGARKGDLIYLADLASLGCCLKRYSKRSYQLVSLQSKSSYSSGSHNRNIICRYLGGNFIGRILSTPKHICRTVAANILYNQDSSTTNRDVLTFHRPDPSPNKWGTRLSCGNGYSQSDDENNYRAYRHHSDTPGTGLRT
jgi:hypothetical protein